MFLCIPCERLKEIVFGIDMIGKTTVDLDRSELVRVSHMIHTSYTKLNGSTAFQMGHYIVETLVG
jgi:hypothetical protein